MNFTKQKITQLDIVLFFRQLATLIAANIPILTSLQLLSHSQHNIAMRKVLHKLQKEIEAGKGLGITLQKFPHLFNELICHLIHLGESTGTLEKTLLQMTTLLEKSLSIKQQIKQALFYPGIVFMLAIFICLGLLIFIVPGFADFFQFYDRPLPWLTRFIIQLSQLLREKYYLLGILIIIFLFLYPTFFNHKQLIMRAASKLPIFKKLHNHLFVLQFVTYLNNLYIAGNTLDYALKMIGTITHPPKNSLLIFRIREQIISGQQLHSAMHASYLFTPMILQMIKVGENTGTLPTMLRTIETFYRAELDRMMTRLNQLLEPLIMVILGVLIGGLIIAMYLPIFRLGMTI
jgi:type IV pilus assembly protein PilC